MFASRSEPCVSIVCGCLLERSHGTRSSAHHQPISWRIIPIKYIQTRFNSIELNEWLLLCACGNVASNGPIGWLHYNKPYFDREASCPQCLIGSVDAPNTVPPVTPSIVINVHRGQWTFIHYIYIYALHIISMDWLHGVPIKATMCGIDTLWTTGTKWQYFVRR